MCARSLRRAALGISRGHERAEWLLWRQFAKPARLPGSALWDELLAVIELWERVSQSHGGSAAVAGSKRGSLCLEERRLSGDPRQIGKLQCLCTEAGWGFVSVPGDV